MSTDNSIKLGFIFVVQDKGAQTRVLAAFNKGLRHTDAARHA